MKKNTETTTDNILASLNGLTMDPQTDLVAEIKKHASKKKIGTVYAYAKAHNLTPEEASKLLKSDKCANELRKVWNYRVFGYCIAEARHALQCAASKKSYHSEYSTPCDPYQYCPRVQKYLVIKQERMIEREKNHRLMEPLDMVSSIEKINEYTKGYGYGYGCVVPLGDQILVIKRHENTVWSEKKSRRWPESRTTSYTVKLLSSHGDTIRTARFDSRAGDWLGKVGTMLGLTISGKNALTQTAAMVPVKEYPKHIYKITELRLYGVGDLVYCASHGDTHYHAPTMREAIVGLNRKIKAHRLNLLDDSEVVTIDQAKRMGFCDFGIRCFLEAIEWCGGRSAKVGEIRAAIRDVDITPWTQELVALGIIPATNQRNPQ